jgi:hypothetical protein
MRKMRWIVAVAALSIAVPTGAASAVSPSSSCPGQELSALAPVLGADLGAFISFEARNPELEGRPNFGAEVSELAQADREDCPEE